MKKFLFLCDFLVLFCCGLEVRCEQSPNLTEYRGIIAIVNGNIITFRDLENRVKMVLLSSGIKDSREIRIEILKEMISEEVKWSCVTKFAPKGGWVRDKEVEASFTDLAKRNNMDPKAFSAMLLEKEVDLPAFKRSMRINMAWQRFIEAKCGKNVFISQRELKSAVENVKRKAKESSFLVSRMFFPVLSSVDVVRVKERVRNIRRMLDGGARFSELARQFSKSPDAKNGGDLGWIFEGQLSPREFSELQQMKVGEIRVLETNRGFYILQLNDRKAAGENVLTHVEFVQVAVPRPEFADGQDTRALLSELKSHFPKVSDFIKQARVIGCYVSEPVQAVQEGMVPEIRDAVSTCHVNGMTKIMSNDKGLFVFCILKRTEEKIPEPTENDIRLQKLNEIFGSLSNKELYELMRRADVEMKTREYGNSAEFI